MLRNERMAMGIGFNVYKRNGERKILLNAYSYLDVNGTVMSVKQNSCVRPQNKKWCTQICDQNASDCASRVMRKCVEECGKRQMSKSKRKNLRYVKTWCFTRSEVCTSISNSNYITYQIISSSACVTACTCMSLHEKI